MRVARRAFLASTLASLAAPAVVRMAQADTSPTTLKLHHSFSAVSSVHDKFLVPWARKVEAESNGRLRIDIFPSMELGGAPAQLFDQARDGTVDIVWAMPGLTPERFAKIETFELPFLPSRRALVSSRALQDFAAVYLKDEFDEIHPICFSCSDRSVIHSYAAVRSIEDIKDMKLHVQTRLAGEAMRVLGAHPVAMPSQELPVAITERVVEGCVDPWHMVPPLRLNDVLKTHTEFSDLSPSSRTYVLAMNKPAYDRLPHDVKTVLDDNSGQLAAGMAGTMWDVQARAVAENVAQSGDVIVTLLPEAVAHWRKATEPVVETWIKDMKEHKLDGGKMIATAHALLAKYADLPEPQPPQAVPQQQEAVTQPQAAQQSAPQASAEVTPAPKTAASPKVDAAASPSSSAPAAKPVAPSAPVTKPAPPVPHTASRAPPSAPAAPPHAAPAPTPPAAQAAVAAPPVVKPPVPAPPAAVPSPAPALKTLNIPL
jgi:TRAP-type transport system periplasmic protein